MIARWISSYVARVVLHGFAARDDEDRRRQAEHGAMALDVLDDLVRQDRMVIQHALVEYHDQARRRLVGRAGHDVAQQQVGGRHDTGREVDRILEVDANLLPDDIHVVQESDTLSSAGPRHGLPEELTATSYVTANSRASDEATRPVARITRL